MQKLRISSSLNVHLFPRDDVSEFIRTGLIFQKQMGYDASDFSCWLIDFLDDSWHTYIEKAIKASEDVGIKFEIGHLPFSVKICRCPEELPAFNQKMHNAIDAMAQMKVKYAVLHPNTITLPMEEYDRNFQHNNVIEHLAPFAEHAAKVNLNLVIENMRLVHSHTPTHRYCQEPDELCNVADELGFGVCWDFGHANTCEFKQSEALSYIGSRLKVLHVNDNKGKDDDHLLPFLGTVDWKDVAKGLTDIGFDGLFNYEVILKNVPSVMKETISRYLMECANEIMSY